MAMEGTQIDKLPMLPIDALFNFWFPEIIKLYEKRLKELNPSVPNITYDVKDLNNYIDHLTELCALVYGNMPSSLYLPSPYTLTPSL
jgi:hypothetical protein